MTSIWKPYSIVHAYTDYTGILWDVTYCHWRIGDTPSICIANRGKSAGHVFPAKTSSFPLSCGLYTRLLTVSWQSLGCPMVLYLANNYLRDCQENVMELPWDWWENGTWLAWEWPVTGVWLAWEWRVRSARGGSWMLSSMVGDCPYRPVIVLIASTLDEVSTLD